MKLRGTMIPLTGGKWYVGRHPAVHMVNVWTPTSGYSYVAVTPEEMNQSDEWWFAVVVLES